MVAGLDVYFGVEARICIGVLDVDRLTGCCHVACNTAPEWEADLAYTGAFGYFRPDLLFREIYQEESAAVGIHHLCGLLHERSEQAVYIQAGCQSFHDQQHCVADGHGWVARSLLLTQ